ncbi:MAG: dihydropteroate synthase [Chlorobi bacterium]|nr:dihydropteroate synthase [Chlorobiota bacterium]
MFVRCREELIDLSRPRVMGILNVTPDSFYAGSRVSQDDLLYRAEKMLREGADFLDVGGYSSRPGAEDVPESEELKRVIPAVRAVHEHFPEARISVDTFRARVAREAVEAGACMINDISGGQADPGMFDTVARLQVPYILMHMRGTPRTMQQLTDYEPDVVTEINRFFARQIARLHELGVNDIIVDPGFGFAKTLEQNYFMLKHLDRFLIHDKPLLAGMSRKSMFFRLLNKTPEEVLIPSVTAHAIAVLKGASVVRVHDVKETREALAVAEELIIIPK